LWEIFFLALFGIWKGREPSCAKAHRPAHTSRALSSPYTSKAKHIPKLLSLR